MPDVISGLEGDLRSNGISVESIDRDGETVELVYLTAFPDVSVNHREVGRALRAFVDVAERSSASGQTSSDRGAESGGWEPARVEATVLRQPEDVQGTWRAEAEWFRRYLNYDLGGEEFSALVLETLSEGAR